MYADDCLLVANASVQEAGVVGEVLKKYYRMSRHKVIVFKSNIIFGAGVKHRQRRCIKHVLQMTKTRCPFQYLRVTVGMWRLPLSVFNPVLEKIRSKLFV